MSCYDKVHFLFEGHDQVLNFLNNPLYHLLIHLKCYYLLKHMSLHTKTHLWGQDTLQSPLFGD
jgi:hypothetical protein